MKIYVIQCGQSPYYKIGKTAAKLKDRLAQLQTGSPLKLRLCGFWESDPGEEKYWHSEYCRYRSSGEWFRLPSDAEIFQFCGINREVFSSGEVSGCVIPSEWRDAA